MNKCIYCCEDVALKGDRVKSREHIIQESIGGTRETETWDCCLVCNRELGASIDVKFVDDPLIKILRIKNEIKNKKGKIPVFEFNGQSTKIPDGLARLSFGKTFDVSVQQKMMSTRVDNGLAEVIKTYGSPDDVKKMLEGKLAKAKKMGLQMFTMNGEEVLNVDEFIKQGATQELGEIAGQITTNSEYVFRGHAKIALGFGHLLYGEKWTFSPSALLLREAATGQKEFPIDFENKFSYCEPVARQLYLKGRQDLGSNHLIGAIVDNDKVYLLVSLFGGEVPCFLFELGSTSDLWAPMMNKSAYLINTKTSEFEWFNLLHLAGIAQ